MSYQHVADASSHSSVIALDDNSTDLDGSGSGESSDLLAWSWTFGWLAPLLATAQERTLQATDSPQLPKSCWSKPNVALLSESWSHSPTPSAFRLAWAIWRVYGWEYCAVGTHLATSTLLGFVGPVLLHSLVTCSEEKAPALQIAGLILALFCSKIVVALTATRYSYRTTLLSISIGSAIKGCIFGKTLRLSTKSRQEFTAGNITNLYTVDIERVVGLAVVLHNFWALPMQIIVAMILLWQVVSYAMFAGLVSICLILLLNNYISVLQKRANDLIMTAKDERMKVTAECFGAMLTIKLNAWEHKFQERILKCREEELRHVWTMLYISAFNICLLWMAPCVVSVSTILTYAKVMHAHVTAARIFTALSLFRILQDPLRQLPGNITQLFQAMSSLQRLQKFYDMADKGADVEGERTAATESSQVQQVEPLQRGHVVVPQSCSQVWFGPSNGREPLESGSGPTSSETKSQGGREQAARLPAVLKCLRGRSTKDASSASVEMLVSSRNDHLDARATLSPLVATSPNIVDTTFVLRLPALNITAGQLVVISGIVGGGKSSTIHALLGEMYPLPSGRAGSSPLYSSAGPVAAGSIAYASQQAWIRNASIKENITWGLPQDAIKYARTIDACCLTDDFVELPFGDETHIGEKGVNLSGGQKARIALARAVFADADIYLLDDVLAALDSIVARRVFQRCILGLLGGKTRILVTHNQDVIAADAVDVHLVLTNGQAEVRSAKPAPRESSFSCIQSISAVPFALSPVSDKAFARQEADRDGNEDDDDDDDDAPSADSIQGLGDLTRNYSFSGRTVCGDDDDVAGAGAADVQVASSKAHSSKKDKGAKNDPQNNNALEERAEGSVDKKVYASYIAAMGGWKVIVFLIIVQTVWQCLSVGSDVYLSMWTKQSAAEQQSQSTRNALLYACLSLGSGSVVLIRTLTISTTGYRAAKLLFESMLTALLHAPMSWLDKNPSGRLLNRFSDDMAKIDCSLPFAMGSIFATMWSVGGDLLTVCVITRYLAFLSVPIFFAYRKVMDLYLRASREIQRLTSMSQSPILTAMSELISGVTIIRAFGQATIQRATAQNNTLLDANGAMQFLSAACSAWFVLRIQAVGALILLFISCLVFFGQWEGFLSPGLVGLSISYGLSISNGLESAVMVLSWFEVSMVCPERVQQYCHVKSEGTEDHKNLFSRRAPPHLGDDGIPGCNDVDVDVDVVVVSQQDHFGGASEEQKSGTPADKACGPQNFSRDLRGAITFENVCFAYQPTSDLVLQNLSFHIPPGHKVGVVGRTGSGKSSLAMALFRIAELASGVIKLDGRDAAKLELPVLRGAIEIIPQSPVLFKGTIRSFVDPFDEYSDAEVWAALQKTRLTDSVARLAAGGGGGGGDGGGGGGGVYQHLYAEVADSGENLSIGERQMLVMSRALLCGAKILVLDESTASVDHDTDAFIQQIIREKFKETTILTIAHRLHTIIDCDKILVMSAGRLVEYDSPAVLLKRPDSLFRALAVDAGLDVPPTNN